MFGNKKGKKVARPIIVNGKQYDSIYKASNELNIDASCLRWSAVHSGKYKGIECRFVTDKPNSTEKLGNLIDRDLFNVQSTTPELRNQLGLKKQTRQRKGVRVESANKAFKSIKAAAKYLNEKPYTLCHILRRDGQFTKDGEVYKAIDPARKMSPYTKTMPKRINPVVETNIITGKSIARSILKEQVNLYIQQDKFNVAKEILEVIESIKD